MALSTEGGRRIDGIGALALQVETQGLFNVTAPLLVPATPGDPPPWPGWDVLLGILRAMSVAASPADRFNAGLRRWQAGDVISADDWARLESARKLLRLKLGQPPATIEPKPADAPDFEPMDWFSRHTKIPGGRLRHAAAPDRKSKRVKADRSDGVIRYSVADARRWWPDDFKS